MGLACWEHWVILRLQLIARIIIFTSAPGRFPPRFPYTLINLRLASSMQTVLYPTWPEWQISALSDVSGMANMSSAIRSLHLKRLEGRVAM